MKTFITLISATIKAQAEYRTSFIVTNIIRGLSFLSDFILLAFIMTSFKELNGWSLPEMAILYSIVECGFCLFRLIGEGLHHFEELTITGRFDTLLVRPVSVLKQVMLQRFEISRVGSVIQICAVGLVAIGFMENPAPYLLPLYFVLIILSSIISFNIILLVSTIAFWTVRNNEIMAMVFYSSRAAATFPVSIFGNYIQKLLTYIIPLATVAYYPLSYLTGKTDNVIALVSPFIAVVVMTPLCIAFWKIGIRHYTGTGT